MLGLIRDRHYRSGMAHVTHIMLGSWNASEGERNWGPRYTDTISVTRYSKQKKQVTREHLAVGQ